MKTVPYGPICTMPSTQAERSCNFCCPQTSVMGVRNVFDMTLDPCGKQNWQECKAQIYGSYSSGPCWRPSCRCPRRGCPPPPPPPPIPKRTRKPCNPNRSCGIIVKEVHPARRIPGCCSCPTVNISCDSACPRVCPTGCPAPSNCPAPDPRPCCSSNCICCRPVWRHACGKPGSICPCPPLLPPRSMKLCKIPPVVDTNLCPSRRSAKIENSGCTIVVVNPPAQCCC